MKKPGYSTEDNLHCSALEDALIFEEIGEITMKRMLLFAVSCIFIIAACNTNDQTTSQMYVKVIDGQGNGIENATVVVGNQAGEVASFLSTDDVGEAYFHVAPSNATVTAAFSCYAPSTNRTYYYVDIAYDVNVSAVTLTLGTCDQITQRVNINVTDKVEGITYSEVTLGPITYSGSSVTMDVYDLQDDGNISVFASGYDDAGNIKGYGFALDQPAVDGSVIEVAIDRTDLNQNTHIFGNVPLNAVSYYAFVALLRKHAVTNLPFNFIWGMAPLPASMTTYSTGGFADNNMFGATVSVDQDSDGNADADIGLIRYLHDVSDQFFDFSLAPLVPGNLTFNPGAARRPIISWSNNDSGSTMQKLSLDYSSTSPQRISFNYTMTVPASAEGLVFPELPDTLAAFRPETYSNLSLETVKFDGPTKYDDYLEAIANYNGRFYEEGALSSYNYSRISRLP